jgi:hypothetical protein
MAAFTDKNDRRWQVDVTTTDIKNVRSLLDFDLLDDDLGGMVGRLAEDMVLVVDVVFLLCREQAEKLGISDADFGRSISGDVLSAAADALIEAIVQYLPHKKKRELLARLWAAILEGFDKAATKALEIVTSGEMERAIDASLEAAMMEAKENLTLGK